jgi:hypothetical protein
MTPADEGIQAARADDRARFAGEAAPSDFSYNPADEGIYAAREEDRARFSKPRRAKR